MFSYNGSFIYVIPLCSEFPSTICSNTNEVSFIAACKCVFLCSDFPVVCVVGQIAKYENNCFGVFKKINTQAEETNMAK